MLISNLIFLALSAAEGAHAYVIAADQSANIDKRELEWDLSKLIVGPPVDSGSVEETPIPQLIDFNLLRHNGSLIYDIPAEGIDVPEALFQKLSGIKSVSSLDKRACQNPCACGTHRTWKLINVDWKKFLGATKVMSSKVCGPGAISSTYSASYSYGITGTIGTSFGPVESIFKGIDLSVGFTYTWGKSIATGYSATCDWTHPCIATFRPYIGQVNGKAQWTEWSNAGNKLCSSGIAGNVEIHLPTTRSCDDKECGADGVWDHCYFLGAPARAMCPNIGKTPRPECAKNLYPGGSG